MSDKGQYPIFLAENHSKPLIEMFSESQRAILEDYIVVGRGSISCLSDLSAFEESMVLIEVSFLDRDNPTVEIKKDVESFMRSAREYVDEHYGHLSMSERARIIVCPAVPQRELSARQLLFLNSVYATLEISWSQGNWL